MFLIYDLKIMVTIPSLENVLKCGPFLISVQPSIVIIEILEVKKFKLTLSILETKSQILQIGSKVVLNAMDGLEIA